MMSSVLLGIGGSQASRAAQRAVFDLVARRRVRLSGIDILDFVRMVSHELPSIGGIQLKAQIESSRLAAAAVRWEAQRKRFMADANDAGIRHGPWSPETDLPDGLPSAISLPYRRRRSWGAGHGEQRSFGAEASRRAH